MTEAAFLQKNLFAKNSIFGPFFRRNFHFCRGKISFFCRIFAKKRRMSVRDFAWQTEKKRV
jgi:hypothetical protein